MDQHPEASYPSTTRQKEIEQVFSFVEKGKSCQLIALPGVGRANVLGFLVFNRNIRIAHVGKEKQVYYHFVLINFSEIKGRPFFDVLKFCFLMLTSSLHERKLQKEFIAVDTLFRQALSYKDDLVLFQNLKQAIYLLTQKNLHIIFLFERFETYIPQVSETFFRTLFGLAEKADDSFCIVFSTTRPLEDTIEPSLLADWYESLVDNHVYLSLTDDTELAARRAYLEDITSKKISSKTYSSLLSLTGGHGKLTRLAMEAVLANNLQETVIDSSFLLERKPIQAALKEIWQFLTPDEQQDILTLCKGKLCPLPSAFLQEVGLIKENKITIPLFSQYLQTQKIENQNTTFFLDETTNTIKRGSIPISDMLTLSEFRLLKLLLQHQNEVVGREEIITAVWADSKTQEGVSEQAVDQLLSRLRKKIEDDPTHPMHIQTVKGRGVKFVQ